MLFIDASAIVFFAFIAVFAAIILGPTIWVGVIVYKSICRMGYKWLAIAITICIFLFIFYSTYTAIFPTDDFYYQEFKTVTLRQIPKSAVIVKKTASYPDFHGDYCSGTKIKLSKRDYNELLKEIKADERLHPGDMLGSSELAEVMGNNPTNQLSYIFNRSIANEEDHYLSIGFLRQSEYCNLYNCGLKFN